MVVVAVVVAEEIFCPCATLKDAPTIDRPFSTRVLVATLLGSPGSKYSDFRFRPRFFFSTPRCLTSKYSRERFAFKPFGPWRFPWSETQKVVINPYSEKQAFPLSSTLRYQQRDFNYLEHKAALQLNHRAQNRLTITLRILVTFPNIISNAVGSR